MGESRGLSNHRHLCRRLLNCYYGRDGLQGVAATVLCSRQRQVPFPESGFLFQGRQSIRVRGGSYRWGDSEIEVIYILLPTHVKERQH